MRFVAKHGFVDVDGDEVSITGSEHSRSLGQEGLAQERQWRAVGRGSIGGRFTCETVPFSATETGSAIGHLPWI